MHFGRYIGLARVVLIIAILGSNISACGQWGIGGGLEYGTAMFVNTPFFVRRPSIGLCAELSYMPREGRLFPSFSYLLKNIQVPVQNSQFADQSDFATDHNFALRLNYRRGMEQNYQLLYLGVGAADIRPERYMDDKSGNAITISDSGNLHIYPLVEAGIKYMRRVLPNSGFYLGLEAQLQYIYMHSQNRYNLHQGNTLAGATIGGDVVMPGVAVKLLYVFDKVERY